MRSSLRKTLQLFSRPDTAIDGPTLAGIVGTEDLRMLIDLHLLVPVSKSDAFCCASCDDSHGLTVRYDESGLPFVACSESFGRQYIEPDDLIRYRLDDRRLL